MAIEGWMRALADWIEVPSVTGDEGDYGDLVARALGAAGFDVERQAVEPGRFNVLARAGTPEVVFCTHLDTVPPWFGAQVERGTIRGRGACDAKGPGLAMLEAGRRLLARGERRFGYLFTVGEETDSCGAAFANERLAEPWAPRFVVVGEPTGGRFVRAGKGIFKAELVARGTAGHSSQDIGPSAIHELVATVQRLLAQGYGEHDVYGPGTLNIGRIEGGVAANVVAADARASILVRTVEPVDVVRARIESSLSPHVALAPGVKAYAPIEFHVPGGLGGLGDEGIVVAYGTDAPHMPRWGTPLLVGPGSILDAHTDHEKIEAAELDLAVERYVRTAERLLASAG
jgi:acetylornithine deacetylase